MQFLNLEPGRASKSPREGTGGGAAVVSTRNPHATYRFGIRQYFLNLVMPKVTCDLYMHMNYFLHFPNNGALCFLHGNQNIIRFVLRQNYNFLKIVCNG